MRLFPILWWQRTYFLHGTEKAFIIMHSKSLSSTCQSCFNPFLDNGSMAEHCWMLFWYRIAWPALCSCGTPIVQHSVTAEPNCIQLNNWKTHRRDKWPGHNLIPHFQETWQLHKNQKQTSSSNTPIYPTCSTFEAELCAIWKLNSAIVTIHFISTSSVTVRLFFVSKGYFHESSRFQ